MKIILALSRVPYPLEKGDKLRAFHQLIGLSKEFDVILFCLTDTAIHPEAMAHIKPYCSEILIHRLSRKRIFLNLVKNVFSKKPFQVAYFDHPAAKEKFDRLVEKHAPKRIICQLVRTAEYAKKYTVIPKLLDYMDALSQGMTRREKLPEHWYSPLVKIEAARLRSYEAAIARYFETKTIISEQDRDLLPVTDKSSIHIVPNGIDTEYYTPVTSPKIHDIIFSGNMSYAPNVDGATYLIRHIMPLVWKIRPETTVVIAGANPVHAVRRLAGGQVVVTGWVEDMRKLYASSRICVAPMRIGTGLQNKLLEAMSMGLPCVTTSLANNALKGTNEIHLSVADEKDSFANAIIQLFSDPAIALQMSSQGRAFVTEKYSWQSANEKLAELIRTSPNRNNTTK